MSQKQISETAEPSVSKAPVVAWPTSSPPPLGVVGTRGAAYIGVTASDHEAVSFAFGALTATGDIQYAPAFHALRNRIRMALERERAALDTRSSAAAKKDLRDGGTGRSEE